MLHATTAKFGVAFNNLERLLQINIAILTRFLRSATTPWPSSGVYTCNYCRVLTHVRCCIIAPQRFKTDNANYEVVLPSQLYEFHKV